MTETTVGIREFKSRLSSYVRRVKSGATVVITDRGRPVGRLVPVSPGLDRRIEDLVRSSLLAWSGRKLEPIVPPVRARGTRTVAALLLEDRE